MLPILISSEPEEQAEKTAAVRTAKAKALEYGVMDPPSVHSSDLTCYVSLYSTKALSSRRRPEKISTKGEIVKK
jgi:hypothetical protein